MPLVSVIMPVYNSQEYLTQSLNSVLNQTLKSIEVICVDDGSTDSSMEILQEVQANDHRIKIIQQENCGGGAARNRGLAEARGKYVIFLDSDDYFENTLLECSVLQADMKNADVVFFDYVQFDKDGKEIKKQGGHVNWLKKSPDSFCYQDIPDLIMSLVTPVPWNKLYRTSFLREYRFQFDEITSTNDVTFASLSVAAARVISYLPKTLVHYRIGHSNTISSTKTKNLQNIVYAVTSTYRQAMQLRHADEIRHSIQRFVIEKYVFALRTYVIDFESETAKSLYSTIHETFNQRFFDDVSALTLRDEALYRYFAIIRKHEYNRINELRKKRIIASFTTYPARIEYISKGIETILLQTRLPDEIVLYLAEEQFPRRETDLTENLLKLSYNGKLKIRWCSEDLRSHKKYYYAMQEYPNDLIVTLDDDLLYGRNMLKNLWESFMLYPEAVSTIRTHLVTYDDSSIRPYKEWIYETDGLLHTPSMQLMATTGAGTLHPAYLFPKETFFKDVFQSICFHADDLWLKSIETLNNIPVVCCQVNETLRYIPGSQTETLYRTNVTEGQNDVQFEAVQRWADRYYGEENVLLKRMLCSKYAKTLPFSEEMIAFYRTALINAKKRECMVRDQGNRERERIKNESNRFNVQLQNENKWLKAQLQNEDKRLKGGNSSGMLLGANLQTENAHLKSQLQWIQNGWSYRIGRKITYIPRKVRGGIHCFKQNGLAYTLAHVCEKIKNKL